MTLRHICSLESSPPVTAVQDPTGRFRQHDCQGSPRVFPSLFAHRASSPRSQETSTSHQMPVNLLYLHVFPAILSCTVGKSLSRCQAMQYQIMWYQLLDERNDARLLYFVSLFFGSPALG